jgi:predicted nucleotidyltransferase
MENEVRARCISSDIDLLVRFDGGASFDRYIYLNLFLKIYWNGG